MEFLDPLRYFVALMLVLALAGLALLVKRYNANPAAFAQGLKGKIGKWEFAAPERRLAIVETLMVGPKQRLILLRRDDVEHLVLAGPDGASIVEAHIAAGKPQP